MSNKIFDKYEVIRRLAVGGMGEIFLCRQSGVAGFDRLVILKTLLPDLARDPEAVNAFLDEARVAATLNHPNIVGIHEVGCWQGVYFIAMEYIEGESVSGLLQAAIGAEIPVTYAVAAKVALQAARGLDNAHRARGLDGEPLNIIHRDVSPQNIMVRKDGVAKVVDFGIARASNRSTRTSTGLVKGKLGYMAPEQIQGKTVDPRSDQWALGAVLWEMLAGRRLLDPSLDQLRRIQKLINEDPVPPSTYAAGVPPELDAIALRMLSREPDGRYQSCGEVAAVLRDTLKLLGIDAADHGDVADLVASAAGELIEGRVSDLTPSGEDFLVTLSGSVRTENLRVSGKRRWLGLAAAFVLFVGVGLGVAMSLRTPSESMDDVTVAVDPTPAPAPESAEEATVAPVLVVTSIPSGATVRAGTFVLGSTPVETSSLAPGAKQVLTIELAGYLPEQLALTLEPGERREEKVELQKRKRKRRVATATKSAQPAVQEDCLITIDSKPWTKVEVDGQPKGPSPVFRLRLRPGSHQVRFVNEVKGIDERRTVSCKSGETLKRTFTFE